MYKYFVSYNHISENDFGFGRCEVIRNKKIKNIDDILEIEEMLKIKNKDFIKIIILNYKLLNKED